MKNQNTKRLKRITALVLCVVLLLTSIPIAFAANGEYNPAPYFSYDAQQKGAAAWLDEEGDLQIRFPAATGRPTHAVWSLNHDETANVKAIKSYVIELSDLGGKLEKHDATPDVLLTKTVPAAAVGTGKLSATFTAAEIEALGDKFDIVNKRYNIAITAVDEAGWHSLQLHALVFDVPEFYFDMSKFQILSEDEHAVRELMRFETVDEKYLGYEQTGDSVKTAGRANSVGAADPTTNVNTYGYRVHISSKPGENGQTIDTTESRQTWNFVGADEVWYWMDLSEVELQGISFRLRANYKRIDYSITDGKIDGSTSQHYGNIVYSTLGTKNNTYTAGNEPYVLVQNENGNWEKLLMKNGTIDLGHFKGYVRIPIEFMCSETSSTIQTDSNVVFGQKKSFNKNNLSTFYDDEVCLGEHNTDTYNTGVFPYSLQVDPAGTKISDALLIQQGKIKAYRKVMGITAETLNYEMGSFLAPGIADEDINKTTANNSKRAYVQKDASGNWTVQNRKKGYKAIEDIYSAGIAYQSVSDDSVNQSFFLDNIMFYQGKNEDGTPVEWEHADLGIGLSDGTTVATYFDQFTDTQDKILDAIDNYIGLPTWTDYRGVKYVDDMIKAFHETYKAAYDAGETAKNPDDFFVPEKLAERAAATKRSQTWQNYLTAKELCGDNNLLDGNNSRPNDLVPMLVQSLEQLPDPSQVTSISGTLYSEIIKDYQAYTRLNYGQLKMLGSYVDTDADGNVKALYEEEKILKYANMLADQLANNTVTGYKMANYPFIPFNTFEENTEVGDKVYHLEDDTNYILNAINGNTNLLNYSQYKNFTSYATDKFNVKQESECNIQYVYPNTDVYAHSAESEITENGYKNTNGYTTTINSSSLNINSNHVEGAVYASRINKDSVNTATNFDEFAANNMSSANLGGLAMSNTVNNEAMQGDTYLPFSLVMYVDFSEMTDETGTGNFYLSFKIHTLDGSNNKKAYFIAMGSTAGSYEWWRSYYFIDPNTGEWIRSAFNPNGYMDGVRFFPSKSIRTDSQGNPISIAGYKGYIAIPMVDFKVKDGLLTENDMLIKNSTELNNIYSVEVVFSAENGEAANFANKSFTIDNIGFTYDPDFYNLKGIDVSGRNDKTYAEIFEAKSSKSTEFEQAVAAIDPYDTTTLATKIEAAKNLYGYPYLSETTSGTLSQWQKDNVQTVKQAKALLDKYIAGDIPTAAMSVDALKTEIAKLPSGIPENAVTSKPLPNPGFIVNASDPLVAGAVNYTDFGFVSRTQAEDIAKLYTDTYKRLSATDKASLTDKERTALINAYNAAMRCTGTLETIKTKGTDFSNHLKTVYTRYTDGTQTLNLISVSKRNEVAALSATEYEPLPYYAKQGLSDGSLIPAFKNMTDGISRFFANTVMNSETGEIEAGGVKVLMDKYTALYAEVKTQLDAKKVLTDDLVSRLNDAIEEYNDLIPAYKNIFELYYGSVQEDASGQYQGIKDIIELFDRYDTAFENPVEGTEGKTATLALNPDNESTASQTLNVNYIEELPVETGGAVKTYFKIHYEGALTGGVDSRSYVLMLNGTEIPAVDKTADPIMITEAMLRDTLKNNTCSAENPFKMVFTARLTGTEEFAQQLSDVVKIYQYRPADPEKGETGEQRIGEYTLNVTYTPKESYVVTIPAEFPIDWGYIDDVDVSYEVDCVLGTGKKIEVDVTGSGKLTAEANSAYTMDYTAEGFGSKSVFTGVHTGSRPANAPTVKISRDMWDNSPVGKYKDTLTYTVEYTKP